MREGVVLCLFIYAQVSAYILCTAEEYAWAGTNSGEIFTLNDLSTRPTGMDPLYFPEEVAQPADGPNSIKIRLISHVNAS